MIGLVATDSAGPVPPLLLPESSSKMTNSYSNLLIYMLKVYSYIQSVI